jgi:hypothetical protein
VNGATTLNSTLAVSGAANLASNLNVSGGLGVTGAATFGSTVTIAGAFTLANNTNSTSSTTGSLIVAGGIGVSGNIRVGSGLGVSGATILGSTLTVAGVVTNSSQTYLADHTNIAAGGLGVTGNTTLNGTLTVTNVSSFGANMNIASGGLGVTGGFTVSGAAILGSTLTVSGAANLANNLNITGGFGVTGAATFGSTVNIAGATAIASNLNVTGGLGVTGQTTLNATTDATSTTSGALIVRGGVGIGGSVYFGGKANFTASTAAYASLRIAPGTYSGTGATSGDLWWDGSGLYFRDGAGNNNNLLSLSGTVTSSGGIVARIPVYSTTTGITPSALYQSGSGSGTSSPATFAVDAGTGVDFFKISNMNASSGTQRGQVSIGTSQNGATYTTLDTSSASLLINPNGGQRTVNVAVFAVAPSTGTTPVAMIDGLGNLRANTKSFDIPHPTKEGYRLVYGVLEGPEHGVYHRGSGFGVESVRIELPEYWSALAFQDYTVMVTPTSPYNVYVSSKDETGFVVSRFGLVDSNEFSFDFFVVGNRQDAPLDIEQI